MEKKDGYVPPLSSSQKKADVETESSVQTVKNAQIPISMRVVKQESWFCLFLGNENHAIFHQEEECGAGVSLSCWSCDASSGIKK